VRRLGPLLLALSAGVAAAQEAPLPEPEGGEAPDASSPEPEGGEAPDAPSPEPDGGEAPDAPSPEPDGGEAPDAAAAAEAEERPTLQRFTILAENDKYAATDRFYTNGLKLAYQRDDVGVVGRALNDVVSLIPFLEAEPLAYGFVFGHEIYTPADTAETLLIPDDRPYGAWLYGGLSLTRGNLPGTEELRFQDRIVLKVGVIGEDALGEEVQNNWHDFINVAKSEGWDNQLRSEVAGQLYLQRKWWLPVFPSESAWIPEADFLPHVGVALGNVFTHFAIGGTFRVGLNLTDDFGPAQRIASAGLDQLYPPDDCRVYVFGRVEGRAVLFNAFIDGNLFRDAPERLSVNGVVEGHALDRERFVADFEVGVVLELYWLSLSFTSVTRTREFQQQGDSFTFGAVHLSVTF